MEKPKTYIDAVKELDKRIEDEWLLNEGVNVRREATEINEESFDPYSVDLLIFSQDGKDFAKLKPRGANIIGALGRVDLEGNRRAEIISFLPEGGPAYTLVKTKNGIVEQRTHRLYDGVTNAGWYWIENKERGKAKGLDKETFLELLSIVSDYELAHYAAV
jgi:hypothetical protein